MQYLNYLKKNINSLIFWFTFHGLALFVNYFNIEGIVFNEYTDFGNSYIKYHKEINLFTTKSHGYEFTSPAFWPINLFSIKFENDYKTETIFPGIFFEYDISEFIAYGIIFFLISYIFLKLDDGFPIQEVLCFMFLLFIICFSVLNLIKYFL